MLVESAAKNAIKLSLFPAEFSLPTFFEEFRHVVLLSMININYQFFKELEVDRKSFNLIVCICTKKFVF